MEQQAERLTVKQYAVRHQKPREVTLPLARECTDPETGRTIANIAAVCERTGVTRRTIYNWLDSGKVKCLAGPNGRKWIYVDTLFRNARAQT